MISMYKKISDLGPRTEMGSSCIWHPKSECLNVLDYLVPDCVDVIINHFVAATNEIKFLA